MPGGSMAATACRYADRERTMVASRREEFRDMEDRDVVFAGVQGDEHAFRELVRRYEAGLLAFVGRMIGDRDEAKDLVQDVFILVHRYLHRYEPTKRFGSWIYSIAANRARNELRQRSRRPLVQLEGMTEHRRGEGWLLEPEDPSSRPDDVFRKRQLCALVAAATLRLSAPHREVFVLRELNGDTYEEIAESTGVKLGTVKSRLSRARQSFAEIVKPWAD
jgi:RNA polymerase sigma-70 factor, ECF subfamily